MQILKPQVCQVCLDKILYNIQILMLQVCQVYLAMILSKNLQILKPQVF